MTKDKNKCSIYIKVHVDADVASEKDLFLLSHRIKVEVNFSGLKVCDFVSKG